MNISVFAEHLFEAAEQEQLPFEEILKRVRAMGIKAVELNFDRFRNNGGLPALFRENGLGVSCVYAFLDFSHGEDMSVAENIADALKGHSIKRLMVIPGFIYENDDAQLCKERMYKCMNRLSELCRAAGITLLIEDFDDRTALFCTSDGLSDFMENVAGLSCAFDTGNFIYSGEDVLCAFEKLKDKVAHVHCKDRSFVPREDGKTKVALDGRVMYSSAVGYGELPIKQLVQSLLQAGYDGYFAIEHYGLKHQLSEIEKSAKNLREWGKMWL